MAKQHFIEGHHIINMGSSFIASQADIFNGDPTTDVVKMANWELCTFLIQKGSGATGTATITVQSCDDYTPTTGTDIAFKYRTQTSGDTWSAWTDATSAGFTTTAGANQLYEIAVSGEDLEDGDVGVQMTMTEVANDPCEGAVVAILAEPRHSGGVPQTALS